MKYCGKCGTALDDGAVFCAKCGNRTNLKPEAQAVSVPSERRDNQPEKPSETVQSIPVEQTRTALSQGNPNEPVYEPAYGSQPDPAAVTPKRFNPLKVIIPVVAGVLVIAAVAAIFLFANQGNIIKKSKDGEWVFDFTPKGYVERFNEANADSMSKELDFADFDKDVNRSDMDLYRYDGSDYAYVLFVDGSGYGSNVSQIKYWWRTGDEYTVPKGVVYEIRAIYPSLSFDEAREIAKKAQRSSSLVSYEYKDIKIDYNYDSDYGAQGWFITPNHK